MTGPEAVIGLAVALGAREVIAYLVRRYTQARQFSAGARKTEAEASAVESQSLATSAGALIDIQRQMFQQMSAEIARVDAAAHASEMEWRARLDRCEQHEHDCNRRVAELEAILARLTA